MTPASAGLQSGRHTAALDLQPAGMGQRPVRT